LLHCPTLKTRIAYCVEGGNLLDTVRFTFNVPLRHFLHNNADKQCCGMDSNPVGSVYSWLFWIQIRLLYMDPDPATSVADPDPEPDPDP